MKRPRVICHMASTVDGRIIAENWGGDLEKYFKIYEECHDSFDSQAWMVGRITMEKDFTGGRKPKLQRGSNSVDRRSFVGDENATSFAIAVDPKGKLGWDSNEIDGDHIVEIVSESVSNKYLNYLATNSISYVVAGKDRIDFKLALRKLHGIFGITTLMLEGGGHVNGSLLREGLIDELSLLILPMADGTPGTPTTFEVGRSQKKRRATQLQLREVQQLGHGVLWVRYESSSQNRKSKATG